MNCLVSAITIRVNNTASPQNSFQGQEVVDLAFCGSVSKIGGLTLDEVIKLCHRCLPFFVLHQVP